MNSLLKAQALVILLAVLAACGQGQAPAAARKTRSAGSIVYSQGADDTQVVIANSASTGGVFSRVITRFNAGIEAYLRMVNESGGIDGRKIVFNHYADDELNPEKGREALRGMVEDAKVFAIVGHYGTPVVAATVEDLKGYGIPAIYFGSGIGALYATGAKTNAEGYNLFPVQPLYRTEGRIMVGFAAGTFRAKHIGIIYTGDGTGQELYQGVIEQASTLSRIRVSSWKILPGGEDLSEAVAALKSADPDFIIVASLQDILPRIIKELAAQHVYKDCITSNVNTSKIVSKAIMPYIKDKFDVYGLGWIDIYDTQSMTLFEKWIEDAYIASLYAEAGWIAAHFFCEGLRRLEGKDITWENYLAAMEQGPIDIPFGGFCDFSGGNRWGTLEMNLFRAIPESDDFPRGWEDVAPRSSVHALLSRIW
jgi:ABC-type branched-subunit amino acid transport system substrate-binding protein